VWFRFLPASAALLIELGRKLGTRFVALICCLKISLETTSRESALNIGLKRDGEIRLSFGVNRGDAHNRVELAALELSADE